MVKVLDITVDENLLRAAVTVVKVLRKINLKRYIDICGAPIEFLIVQPF